MTSMGPARSRRVRVREEIREWARDVPGHALGHSRVFPSRPASSRLVPPKSPDLREQSNTGRRRMHQDSQDPLSRWRHGFEPRWDYRRSPAATTKTKAQGCPGPFAFPPSFPPLLGKGGMLIVPIAQRLPVVRGKHADAVSWILVPGETSSSTRSSRRSPARLSQSDARDRSALPGGLSSSRTAASCSSHGRC